MSDKSVLPKTIEVIICPICKGSGYNLTSLFHNKYNECTTCSGKGRLNKIVTYERLS